MFVSRALFKSSSTRHAAISTRWPFENRPWICGSPHTWSYKGSSTFFYRWVCLIKSARCGMLKKKHTTERRRARPTWPHVCFEVKHEEREKQPVTLEPSPRHRRRRRHRAEGTGCVCVEVRDDTLMAVRTHRRAGGGYANANGEGSPPPSVRMLRGKLLYSGAFTVKRFGWP